MSPKRQPIEYARAVEQSGRLEETIVALQNTDIGRKLSRAGIAATVLTIGNLPLKNGITVLSKTIEPATSKTTYINLTHHKPVPSPRKPVDMNKHFKELAKRHIFDELRILYWRLKHIITKKPCGNKITYNEKHYFVTREPPDFELKYKHKLDK